MLFCNVFREVSRRLTHPAHAGSTWDSGLWAGADDGNPVTPHRLAGARGPQRGDERELYLTPASSLGSRGLGGPTWRTERSEATVAGARKLSLARTPWGCRDLNPGPCLAHLVRDTAGISYLEVQTLMCNIIIIPLLSLLVVWLVSWVLPALRILTILLCCMFLAVHRTQTLV
jgi:hypothetical protein